MQEGQLLMTQADRDRLVTLKKAKEEADYAARGCRGTGGEHSAFYTDKASISLYPRSTTRHRLSSVTKPASTCRMRSSASNCHSGSRAFMPPASCVETSTVPGGMSCGPPPKGPRAARFVPRRAG